MDSPARQDVGAYARQVGASPGLLRFLLRLSPSLLLLFVWSIPGTIALRHALLLTGLVTVAACFRPGQWQALHCARAPLLALAAFTAWLFVQAFLVSAEPAWVLQEISGQWLTALLALALGIGLGLLAQRKHEGASWLLLAIVLVFSLQTLIALGQSFAHWLDTGELLQGFVPLTGGKLGMSFIVNILLAFLAVDLFGRASGRGRLLPVPISLPLLSLACALASLYLAGARNGLLGMVFLATSATYLYLYDQRLRIGRWRSVGIGALASLLIGAFTLASVNADARWQVFGETARIAWDIDTHTTWRETETELPKLASGERVDDSGYFRIAWLRAGSRMISENPLGVGYGRSAFGHALHLNSAGQGGHADSGFIDLGVGGGVPALACWLAFIASLIWLGWRSFVSGRENLAGLLLILLSTGFTGRMLIDSVNRDHLLQIFMFLAGILLVLASAPAANAQPLSSHREALRR